MKVMLAIEFTRLLDVAVQRESCPQSWNECFFLEEGLRAGHCDVEECDMAVWCIVYRGSCWGEELTRSVELCMYFDTHCEFPIIQALIIRLVLFIPSLCFLLLCCIFQLFTVRYFGCHTVIVNYGMETSRSMRLREAQRWSELPS